MEQSEKERASLRTEYGTPVGRSLADECFPERFEFFDFGRIESTTKKTEFKDFITSPFLVAFRVSGDESGLCIVAFDQRPASGEEASMFVEMSNILVSKFITVMADSTGTLIELMPPECLELGGRKHRFLLATLQVAKPGDVFSRRYEYISGSKRNILRLAYIPSRHARGGNT